MKYHEPFNVVKRAKSVTHALRGIAVVFKTTPNVWVHVMVAVCAVVLGIFFNITTTEWLFLIISIGTVFVTEAVNSAIEIDIDLTSPEYHPFARDTKDVAAGAVLLMGITSWVIGIIIFTPKIYTFLVS
jgi:diacylglycerol kinase